MNVPFRYIAASPHARCTDSAVVYDRWGSITVPSAETDQTGLLQINYGTGVRRLTVIIP